MTSIPGTKQTKIRQVMQILSLGFSWKSDNALWKVYKSNYFLQLEKKKYLVIHTPNYFPNQFKS